MKKNIRCCAGCRIVNHKAFLIRLVLQQDQLVLATPGFIGASVYVCRNARCWHKARKHKKWGRLLPVELPVNGT